MNSPEDFQNEPPILPDRNTPEEWQRLIADFLGGTMNMNQKGSLREKIKGDPGFQAYVSGWAATEAQLAALLAESRYQHAEPKEPPAWAMERLRGAVAKIGRAGESREGGWARFLSWFQDLMGIGGKAAREDVSEPEVIIFGAAMPSRDRRAAPEPQRMSWFTLPRVVLAGSVVAIVAGTVMVIPKLGERSSGLAAGAPEIKELLVLSPEAFIASVGSPNVVRSAGRHFYSPSGISSQIDPIVLLSPDWKERTVKIEIRVLEKPDLAPLQGDYQGVPQPLSKIIGIDPGLQPGVVYQIRLIAQGETISEETFRISDRADGLIPPNPSEVLRTALEAVNDVPPRPGDALGLLAQLPEIHQNDQAVIRVCYKALIQMGAASEANEYKSRIR